MPEQGKPRAEDLETSHSKTRLLDRVGAVFHVVVWVGDQWGAPLIATGMWVERRMETRRLQRDMHVEQASSEDSTARWHDHRILQLQLEEQRSLELLAMSLHSQNGVRRCGDSGRSVRCENVRQPC